MASLLAINFMSMLGFGIIIPLLPFYARSLRAEPWQVSLIFSAYANDRPSGAPPAIDTLDAALVTIAETN